MVKQSYTKPILLPSLFERGLLLDLEEFEPDGESSEGLVLGVELFEDDVSVVFRMV